VDAGGKKKAARKASPAAIGFQNCNRNALALKVIEAGLLFHAW
jgi:hypothetical protein